MARIVRITWEELQVHQSESYGITGEAGSSAEWRVYLVVKIDGKERRWERFERSGIRDNRTYKVDREIDVALDGELSIEVMASELDDSSDDDHIPGFSRTHAPEAGWETGGTRYRKGRGSLDFDYTIQYRIQYISEGATLTPGKGQIFDVRYSGLWDASSERCVYAIGRTAAQVHAQAAELWPLGGRLAQLQPHVLGNDIRYNVIWAFSGIRQLWNIDCDEAHFRRTTDETWSWARPHAVIPFVVNGQVRYACLWNEGQHGQVWNPHTDEPGFRATTGETWNWARPHQLHAFVVGGKVRYSCLWNAGMHAQLWHPNCSEAEVAKLGSDNWNWGRAHRIQPFTQGRERRYTLLWNAGQQGQLWNINCDQLRVDRNATETKDWARPKQILAP